MMKSALIGLLTLVASAPVFAQVQQQQSLGGTVAGLREDVRLLSQRMGSMALRIEQLERENAALMGATDGLETTYATVSQLNDAVAEINQSIRSGDSTTRSQLSAAIQKLAQETNSALDDLAKNLTVRKTISTPTFTDDFPKEGLSYTIQKGDTLSSIASRFKSTIKDIQNANRITDPTKIQVGQTLFIPGGN
ncbi:LysM peptidoglycan-binding domain-containing protein [Synoicihabitans lomoniglobus]|uniref:LysM peptidoglycan-binding domain-containing protein n=1 Tax=Synoicihabitans lomoniglobus TaxID=2909285 RepID=A0AAF0I4M8_9BACT|nr:LysM peptidoglycan-binding domain-containing protein [Opitutaceae bacterium LMO-M01]WED66884.1 LysM peptidoglycan-binding domain-containing protein [Opitutaceae bacterium LMO-M01]